MSLTKFDLIIFITLYVVGCSGYQNAENGRQDFAGCAGVLEQCSHAQEEMAQLLCAYNVTRRAPASVQCQQKIWSRRARLLEADNLNRVLNVPCAEEPVVLECFTRPAASPIDCVLQNKPTIRDRMCWRIVNRVESVIFNDWQLVDRFVKYCKSDVESLVCGRLNVAPNSLSQNETLLCLAKHEERVSGDCQAEVAALKEMKYNSMQLDKLVFAACNGDHKRFCSDEVSNSWLLYKCLVQHKYENSMSKRCQEQLFNQQKLIVMNYKMSKGLARACKEDIRKHRCRKGVVDDKDVRLAQILVCLEIVVRNDSTKVSPDCTAEMIDHRKMLMDDYRLSPELMHDCAKDISEMCNGVETGGKTIHCLMEHARPRKKKEKRISPACQKSLESLVQEADPGEDWRVDPILRKACKPVVDRACRELVGDRPNGRVMSCLMEKLGTALMTDDCETALMQIQYFISRDFKLEPQLFKACKYDAVTQCKAKLSWVEGQDYQPARDPFILPCLYNFVYNIENNKSVRLQSACEQEVRRVMRQRAISVDLLPEIEDYCMNDLANLCFENKGKGEEIACLQTKIKELTSKCKEAVTNFTEAQSGHIELNAVVSINCRIPIDKLCFAEVKSRKDEDDVMDCLISNKNNFEIKSNQKCRAAIEHQQLISLKNYRFTRRFKNACRTHVVRFCPNAQTKTQVVTCLSEIVRNDTILDKKPAITRDCRQQLRNQLFQQKENIDLDPELREACRKDLSTYCSNIPFGESAALECLQTFSGQLSEDCHRGIFVLRKQEFADNMIDYHLVTTCHSMIDKYCRDKVQEGSTILDCLKNHRQQPDFDDKCKVVIVNRMIEQNTDYRFNNKLQTACKDDIKKFCVNIIATEPQDVELQGKVLKCLKDKFRESKLSNTCENEIAEVLKEQALNIRLDPLLGALCKAEIQTICKPKDNSITNFDGEVEECLKNALLNGKIVSAECIHEVAQRIEESELDIGADPLLERACALDLLKYCSDLDRGNGRRLNCLKIVLNDDGDSNRQLTKTCETELSNRIKMYRHVAAIRAPEGLSDIYEQVSASPAKRYILVVMISIVGLVFIFGLFCGKMTRRAMYVKRK